GVAWSIGPGLELSDGVMIRSREVQEKSSSNDVALGAFLLFSLKEQWGSYRKKLKCCQKDASEEAVHEFRIATRRLLSILMLLEGVISPKRLQTAQRDPKKGLKSLGRLRDTHTQMRYLENRRLKSAEALTYYKALEKREC